MANDDKSMDVQLICSQSVLDYIKLQSMNPMGVSAPWANSLDIISFRPVKTFHI